MTCISSNSFRPTVSTYWILMVATIVTIRKPARERHTRVRCRRQGNRYQGPGISFPQWSSSIECREQRVEEDYSGYVSRANEKAAYDSRLGRTK